MDKQKRKKLKTAAKGYAFIGINLIGVLIFWTVPMLFSFIISISKWDFSKGFKGIKIVGFSNYIEIWRDAWFRASLINNIVFTVSYVVILIVLSFIVAYLLNEYVVGKKFVQLGLYLPYIVNIVAISAVWLALFSVGFKNGTDGTIKVAIDAINAAGAPHCFLSVTKWGHSAIVNTSGNGDCHIILRGGKEPNYSAKHVAEVKEGLNKAGLPAQVMIDFSHANSSKQFKKQMDVCTDVCQQIAGGEKAIIGVMVESHLVEGNQSLESGEPLAYGKSITDACIGWDDTDALLRQLASAVKARRG